MGGGRGGRYGSDERSAATATAAAAVAVSVAMSVFTASGSGRGGRGYRIGSVNAAREGERRGIGTFEGTRRAATREGRRWQGCSYLPYSQYTKVPRPTRSAADSSR